MADAKAPELPKMKAKRSEYPFTAIVGQEVLKRALVLNVVNPKVGGVLIRGEKGTGKSIAVRALAEVLNIPLLVELDRDLLGAERSSDGGLIRSLRARSSFRMCASDSTRECPNRTDPVR